MLELGNEAQVRSALEGKSGFDKGIEDELIRRIAIAEAEQDQYEPLSKGSLAGLVALTIAGVILTVVSFL